MASDLCIQRNDSKWEIRDSPAKKQRCDGYASPPPPPSPSPSPSPSALCSLAEEEKEDPRSKIVFYNYDDDSDVEDDSDGMHEFTDKEFQEYDRQLTQSDGFDVMCFPRSFGCSGTSPVFNLDEIADDLKTFAELALKQYNDKELKNLEFVKVVKANRGLFAGFMYYITFDVKDADAVDGGTMEFQACVWDGIGHTDVLISRLKISTYINNRREEEHQSIREDTLIEGVIRDLRNQVMRVEFTSLKIAPELRKRKERCNRRNHILINDRQSFLEEHGIIAIE
ncbi:unnamed protein product [Camellia sinensis]